MDEPQQVELTTRITNAYAKINKFLVEQKITEEQMEDPYSYTSLAFKLQNRDMFVKQSKERWGMKRDVARVIYSDIRTAALKDGTWPKKVVEPTKSVPNQSGQHLTKEALLAGYDEAETSERTIQFLANVGAQVFSMSEINAPNETLIAYVQNATGLDEKLAFEFVALIQNPEINSTPQLMRTIINFLKSKAQFDSSLDGQIQSIRTNAVKAEMDPEAGKAEGQFKRDLAGDSQSALVQVARRIGRDLSKNGPITIDDITEEMSKRYNVIHDPTRDQKSQNWKGSVFSTSEWVCIGSQPSRQKNAHARLVRLWALKSWINTNTLNGRNTHVSAYVVSRLFSDFKRIHPQIDHKGCNWFIGEEKLAAEIRETITKDGNKLYNIAVSFLPGAVGALLMPQQIVKLDACTV